MINRNLFAAAAEKAYKTIKYSLVDCQAFVENCAKEAGHNFNARGTNDIWRNYLAAKGETGSFPLSVGDVVFKWRGESNKLPTRYKGDGNGDIYHIGIITSLNPLTVIHSANSKDNGKKDTYSNQAQLAAVWKLAGTLKNTEEAQQEATIEKVQKLLEEAAQLLEEIGAENKV